MSSANDPVTLVKAVAEGKKIRSRDGLQNKLIKRTRPKHQTGDPPLWEDWGEFARAVDKGFERFNERRGKESAHAEAHKN